MFTSSRNNDNFWYFCLLEWLSERCYHGSAGIYRALLWKLWWCLGFWSSCPCQEPAEGGILTSCSFGAHVRISCSVPTQSWVGAGWVPGALLAPSWSRHDCFSFSPCWFELGISRALESLCNFFSFSLGSIWPLHSTWSHLIFPVIPILQSSKLTLREIELIAQSLKSYAWAWQNWDSNPSWGESLLELQGNGLTES